jgi:DNA-directed RNA polymerase subunit RPC12/RpoP
MVATCPNTNCAKQIPADHSYSWCTACGEQLPESIQIQLTKLQEGRRNAEVARAALGSQPEIEETCTNCGAHFMASAKLGSLGFREFTCPNCHLRTITPLRWSYRITYWVFLCLWALALIQMFQDGKLDSGFVAVGLWIYYILQAILKDLKIVYHERVYRQRSS